MQQKQPGKGRIPLAAGFGIMLALMAALLLFSLDRMKSLNADLQTLDHVANEKARLVGSMRAAVLKRFYSLALVPTLVGFFERDEERQRFNQYQRDYIIARDKLVALGLDEAERAHYEALQNTLRGIMLAVEHAMELAVEKEADRQTWLAIQEAMGAQRIVVDHLNALVDEIVQNAAQATDTTLAEYEAVRQAMLVLGGTVLLLGAMIAVFVIRRETVSTHALIDEIARRRDAEAAAKELNAKLEEKVRARTVELSHTIDALRIARDEAESANLTKSQFLATMSHELRTPLNAIIGFADTMQQEVFGPVGNERYNGYIDDIKDSGHHLLELINDILDISAIESGKLELALEPLHPAALVDTSVRLVQPVADKAGIVMDTQVPASLPPIYGDDRRTKQILVNLLSNAVKFTPDGGTVSLTVAADHGTGKIVFTIADTGIGMDAQGLVKALSKFGQVDSALSRKYDGTGLGLPLAKELTEAQHGTFAISSALGHGTTVTIALPAARADAA